jgi:hemoglobin/transferrin/lactoferrin receptor protein
MKKSLFFGIFLPLVSFANTKEESLEEKKIYITTEKIEITEGMTSNDLIEREQITRNPNKNIGDITKTLPNVERTGSIRGSNSEFKIRGMEDTRITTKIDGAKSNFRGEYKGRNFISSFMLSEISVIRGSNSVMEGSGSVAGSVNLRTKEVEDIALNKDAKKGNEIFSSYSTNGNMQNYGASTFVKENGYSILGLYNFTRNNDFKMAKEQEISKNQKTKTIEYTENKTQNAILKLKKDFNEKEFFKIQGAVFTEDGENTSNPFRLASNFRGEPVDKSLTNARTQAELELEQVNIKAFYDKTNIKEVALKDGRVDKTEGSSYGLNTYGKYQYKTSNIENLIFYGAELTKDTQSADREKVQGTDRANIYPTGSARNEGLYFQNALKYNNLKVLLGLRQDYYNLESGGEEVKHTSKLLKKVVVSYDINGFTPFVRYSEGYRSPLVKEVFAKGDIVNVRGFRLKLIENLDLKPEYSKNYEAGFKILKEDLLEDNSQTSLNFTYFIQDIKDFIIQDPKCFNGFTPEQTGCSSYFPATLLTYQYQNLDKVKLKGIELEAKYQSSKYLLSATVSTLSAKESNGNKILQIPASKLVLKVARKFENGISIGVESVSVGSVKGDNFRSYSNLITGNNFIPVGSNANTKPTITQILSGAKDCIDARLCEKTNGYSLVNFNIDYTKKLSNYEFLIGTSLQNAFNVEYKEQTSYIPGMGRSVNIYARIKY